MQLECNFVCTFYNSAKLVSRWWNHCVPLEKAPLPPLEKVSPPPPSPPVHAPPPIFRRPRPLETRDMNSLPRIRNRISTPHITVPLHVRLKSCPNCQSPTKELNRRRSQCLVCNFDYCRQCFKQWHKERCPGVGTPDTRNSVLIVGTSSSKKRLKRL